MNSCDNCQGPSENLQPRNGYMACPDCCDLADSPFADRMQCADQPHSYTNHGGAVGCFDCGRPSKDRVHTAAGQPSVQQMTTWPGLGGKR